MAESIAPPGKARVLPCPDCKGIPGRDCHGTGQHLMRACPRCGDVGWDCINGTDDRNGMACRSNCGNTWTTDDTGRCAQVLPDGKV